MCGPLFTPDDETAFVAVQHPGDGGEDWPGHGRPSYYEDLSTRWPDFKDNMPVRPAVVAITKAGGTLAHGLKGTVDWKITRLLATGSLPAAAITLALIGHFAPGGIEGAAEQAYLSLQAWLAHGEVVPVTARSREVLSLDPLAPPDQFLPIPRETTYFLSLRYERQAGSPSAVLGGLPGAAAGGIRGSVFLDENGDGVRSASELPAVNVTVLLDGRYAVRTDSQGEFEFPRVATGAHTVQVVPDNLPLPWFLEGDAARRAVEVKVRESARVEMLMREHAWVGFRYGALLGAAELSVRAMDGDRITRVGIRLG